MSIFAVNAVAADGLAPQGARPSAGTEMIKFAYLIQDPHLWRWKASTIATAIQQPHQDR